MDTAQRGMGLDWPTSLELIRRSHRRRHATCPGALLASGCGTDHLAPEDAKTVDDVIRAYEEQMAAIEKLGGKLIVMASRALARVARSPADYERVYDRVLSQARQPVVLHWLGDMFDPALAGYWGSADVGAAMDTALGIIDAHAGQGRRHQDLAARQGQGDRDAPPPAGRRAHVHRRRLQLRRADRRRRRRRGAHAPAQRRAAGHLRRHRAGGERRAGGAGAGDDARFHAILAPTVPLSRHIFQAPTRFYKTGVVFMAWLNGHQDHFTMVGGQQSTRSLPHFAELFRLADAAGLLEQPELAVRRMKTLLALHGGRDLAAPMRDFSPTTAGCRSTPPRCASSAAQDWPLLDILDACAARGIRAISPWRDQVAAAGLQATAQRLTRHGLELSGYCRGGMFTDTDAAARQAARDDNQRALDEACTLNAPCLVLVVGGLPGALAGQAAHKDIAGARAAGQRRHRRAAGRCARTAHAAGHRAAAPDVRGRPRLHQHAGAGARRLRCARPAAQRRARRGGRRVPRLVGPEAARADRARRQARLLALPRLRLAHAHHRPARTTAA